MARVRSITIDDAHVFCRRSQVWDEISKIWDIVNTFYSIFSFNLKVRLSLRDPKQQKNYLGTPALWKESEDTLRGLAKKRGVKTVEAIGEAAFYGPKIDFLATDSLGREWQVATIQLDMNQPERFDLACINEKGERERIVMIHAAIMGSIERFLSILIEHYAGAFPFWLAPVQIGILSLNESTGHYVMEIGHKLETLGYRIWTDQRNETIGKKIREAELQKIPYLFIIGPKEMQNMTVAVRERGRGDLGQMRIEQFLLRCGKNLG